MACKCTKFEIEFLIIGALCVALRRSDVTTDSTLEGDLGLDKLAKRRLFTPVKRAVDHDDCDLKKVRRKDFEGFKSVQDIIDAVNKEFQCT